MLHIGSVWHRLALLFTFLARSFVCAFIVQLHWISYLLHCMYIYECWYSTKDKTTISFPFQFQCALFEPIFFSKRVWKQTRNTFHKTKATHIKKNVLLLHSTLAEKQQHLHTGNHRTLWIFSISSIQDAGERMKTKGIRIRRTYFWYGIGMGLCTLKLYMAIHISCCCFYEPFSAYIFPPAIPYVDFKYFKLFKHISSHIPSIHFSKIASFSFSHI